MEQYLFEDVKNNNVKLLIQHSNDQTSNLMSANYSLKYVKEFSKKIVFFIFLNFNELK